MQKTRIFTALLLIAVLCIALSSCFFFGAGKPWEEDKLTNTFFGTEYLAERGVADFPVPKLEGSYFDADENVLYLNLSREEFDAYTNTVTDYLLKNENLAVKGYHCGNDIWGLLIIPIRIYQLAPLDMENISYLSENERLFGFSTEEPDDLYDGEAEVKNVKFVSLVWEPTTKKSGASYTAVMKFPALTMRAEYLPCHHSHDFESITYPVPGTVFTTTIHTCRRCGEVTREGYGYGNEEIQFSLIVVEGAELIVSKIPEKAWRGSLIEITTKAPEGTELKVIINGTEIPKIRDFEDEQIYAFIMPYGGIEVEVEAVEHVHTGRWGCGEESHWYEYTCGCESNDIAELHYDHDNNGLCDACAYMVGVRQHYSLMMNAPEWLYEKLKYTYYEGETVSVKISMATDVGFLFFANGEEITDYQDNTGLYWEFTFTMPNCDTYIHFKTYDGFLPHANYATLIETYYRQNLDSGSVRVKCYYGEFSSGAIVAMLDIGDYHYSEAEWEEAVGGSVIHYSDSNRIVALCPNNKFYTLTEAFENGYLTAENIAAIAEMHNSNQ